jgi:hypothetical protein
MPKPQSTWRCLNENHDMKELGIDPGQIGIIVISHAHGFRDFDRLDGRPVSGIFRRKLEELVSGEQVYRGRQDIG